MFKIYLKRNGVIRACVLMALLFAFTNAYSQAAYYGFTQQEGTYLPLDNPTLIAEPTAQTGTGAVDDNNYDLPEGTIPFPFSYSGQTFTGLKVYANGFVTFGATAITGSSPISNSTTSIQGAISPLGADLHALYNLNGITGNISYEVVGTAPNREFVIQWSHFKPYASTTSTTNYFDWSFQLRLKEDNSIQFVYDMYVTGTPTSSSAQVGLRGALATDYSTRYSISNWAATAAGTSNSSTVTSNTTSLPPSGLTFNWSSPLPCEAPTAQATGLSFTVNGVILTGTFTAANPGADKYLVLRNVEGTVPNAPVNGTAYTTGNNTSLNAYVSYIGTGTTFTDNALNGILGNTNYTYTIYALSSACTGGPLYNTDTPLEADVTSCPAPINTISSAGVTTTGFDINWVANNGTALPLSYIIEVSADADFSSQVDGSPFTVAAPELTVNISGLDPATKYYFRMKAETDCGTSVVSATKNVTTACLPTDSITESFTGLASDVLPACWSKIIRGTGVSSATVGVSTTNGVGSSPAVSLYNSGANVTSAGNDVILVSPQLSNLNSGTYRLRFKAKRSSSAAGNDIQVGTLTDNTATAVFTPIGGVTTLSSDFIEYIVYFTNVTGTDQYIGIRKTGSSTYTSAYIDDVVWEPVPSCIVPVALSATNITNTTATVNWNFEAQSGAPAGGYEYAVSATNTPPADADIIATDDITAVVDNLTTGTTYYLYVRSVCSDTDKSEWASVSFATKLVVPAPWTEGFATTAVPAGWATTGWTLGSSRGATGNTGTNIYKNLYGSTPAGSFNTVNVGPLPVGAELSFDYKQSAYNSPYAPLATWGSFEIQISTDFGATWATLATVTDEAGTGSYISKTFPLNDYQGQIISLKITGNRTAGDFDLSFDNFRIAGEAMGTADLIKTGFVVYPNPVENVLTINSVSPVKTVKLFTLTGQLAGTYTSGTINVSALPAGAYILNIELENGSTGSQKVIKK